MYNRFDLESGQLQLKKYFSEVHMEILQGKIIVDSAEPMVDYKSSSIKGSSVLVGDTKGKFEKYIADYIKKKSQHINNHKSRHI